MAVSMATLAACSKTPENPAEIWDAKKIASRPAEIPDSVKPPVFNPNDTRSKASTVTKGVAEQPTVIKNVPIQLAPAVVLPDQLPKKDAASASK